MKRTPYRDPERAALAAEREAKMRKRGYISVNEAARLVSVPRSNIYHWITTGELRKGTWGDGGGSVFVLLSDLQVKVPAAFDVVVKPVGRAPTAPKPLKAAVRAAARKRAS